MSLSTFLNTASPVLSVATASTCVVLSYPAGVDTITHSSGDVRYFPVSTYTAITIETYNRSARTVPTCIKPGNRIPTNTIPGLTPSVATATTCVVESLPDEYYTKTYSSGDTDFWGTTYNALTTITSVRSATPHATCINPGEIIPSATLATTKEGIKCSTVTVPESTKTITYEPGVSGIVFKTTRTVAETATVVQTTYTYAQCSIVPEFRNPETCNEIEALTWVLLVITFITIQLTWWIFELPLLWKKDAGIRSFFDAIAWNCLKAHAAGSAGVIAGRVGEDTSEFARVYYMGKKRYETSPPPWIPWKLSTSIASDVLTIASTIITLYQACTLPKADAKRYFGVELWVYPTLPVALIGLSFLAGERFLPRTRKGSQILLLLTIALLVVVEAVVSIVLWKYNQIWWISIMFYTVMIIPLIYFPQIHFLPCIAGCFVRVGGVAIAAFSHYAGGQPYCKMSGIGFAIVYIVLGVIAALFALIGGYYHSYRLTKAK